MSSANTFKGMQANTKEVYAKSKDKSKKKPTKFKKLLSMMKKEEC